MKAALKSYYYLFERRKNSGVWPSYSEDSWPLYVVDNAIPLGQQVLMPGNGGVDVFGSLSDFVAMVLDWSFSGILYLPNRIFKVISWVTFPRL